MDDTTCPICGWRACTPEGLSFHVWEEHLPWCDERGLVDCKICFCNVDGFRFWSKNRYHSHVIHDSRGGVVKHYFDCLLGNP